MKRIPEIGEILPFFDDGKMSPSRHYMATVTKIMTVDDSKNIFYDVLDEEDGQKKKISLYEIWRNEIDSHRNSEGFMVLSHGSNSKPGEPWLYAEDTDCFVVCDIPDYDKKPIVFARMVGGGWFSMDTESWWMSGRLDVDLDIFNQWEEFFPEEYWANVEKYKKA